jgi:hypothetical protein
MYRSTEPHNGFSAIRLTIRYFDWAAEMNVVEDFNEDEVVYHLGVMMGTFYDNLFEEAHPAKIAMLDFLEGTGTNEVLWHPHVGEWQTELLSTSFPKGVFISEPLPVFSPAPNLHRAPILSTRLRKYGKNCEQLLAYFPEITRLVLIDG